MENEKEEKSKKFLGLIITDIQGHTTQYRNPFIGKILRWIKKEKQTGSQG